MPKASVTDPITEQEITFAHLLLSGTMNDREAAKAAGLNPTTASYTKSKARIREYMDRHRAAVSEKLVEQEVEELRKFSVDRDQYLAQLWKLATLDPEVTKGSIAGQIKAMAMIGAVQGFLPDRTSGRRGAPADGQFAAPASTPNIYVSKWMRQRQAEPATTMETEKNPPPPPPEAPGKPANEARPTAATENPVEEDAFPKGVTWAPDALGPALDTYPTPTSPLRLPLDLKRFGRGR